MAATIQSIRGGGGHRPGVDRPVKVLVVDDSAVVRKMIARELERDPMLKVVGAAPDPYVARDMIVEFEPDVLTLDVEMPRMDGITFLRALMRHHPLPTIVISSLTAHGTQTAIEAMSAGAVDVLSKPGSAYTVAGLGPVLVQKVKAAALSRVRAFSGDDCAAPAAAARPTASPTRLAAAASATAGPHVASIKPGRDDVLIAIGASTGGVQALTEVLTALPGNAPPIVIVQHMPPKFTASFAERLDRCCAVRVKEAADGDAVAAGRVLIAPGGFHMIVRGVPGRWAIDIRHGPEVFHQRPSVEVLFNSVARCAGRGRSAPCSPEWAPTGPQACWRCAAPALTPLPRMSPPASCLECRWKRSRSGRPRKSSPSATSPERCSISPNRSRRARRAWPPILVNRPS